MQDQFTPVYLEIIPTRLLHQQGGFANQTGGGYRADATAWAVVALRLLGLDQGFIKEARASLAARQLADGRVPLSPQHPEAFWPTPLAIFAWHQAPEHGQALARAGDFLRHTTGVHWKRGTEFYPFEHDPALKGWPWIADTHSWVEPTALAIMALRMTGSGEHPRVKEGIRLIMDRQLPGGGWNYGNTKVFGQELHPFPESTGLALNALRGVVPREQVQKSLDFLQARLQKVRTPLALSWGLMGLAAWGQEPGGALSWIEESLCRQTRYGPYDTNNLSLLMVASRARQGFESVFTS